MRTIAQEVTALTIQAPAAITSTTTTAAKSVATYNSDAAAVVSLGAFTSNPTIVVTVVGSLDATPTVYDQTLATFPSASAAGVAVAQLNLAGISNIKFVYTMAGGSSPSVPVSGVALVTPFVKSASANSTTFA